MGKAKPCTKNIMGLNLAVVRRTTDQVTELPCSRSDYRAGLKEAQHLMYIQNNRYNMSKHVNKLDEPTA